MPQWIQLLDQSEEPPLVLSVDLSEDPSGDPSGEQSGTLSVAHWAPLEVGRP